jgi:uncharacterized membrane protein YhiD involved in acid resistance
MLDHGEIILRLVTAAVLGAVVGLDDGRALDGVEKVSA